MIFQISLLRRTLALFLGGYLTTDSLLWIMEKLSCSVATNLIELSWLGQPTVFYYWMFQLLYRKNLHTLFKSFYFLSTVFILLSVPMKNFYLHLSDTLADLKVICSYERNRQLLKCVTRSWRNCKLHISSTCCDFWAFYILHIQVGGGCRFFYTHVSGKIVDIYLLFFVLRLRSYYSFWDQMSTR